MSKTVYRVIKERNDKGYEVENHYYIETFQDDGSVPTVTQAPKDQEAVGLLRNSLMGMLKALDEPMLQMQSHGRERVMVAWK